MPFARLPDRAVLTVTGPAAADFLQNLVTADLEALGADEARPAALLTPQGKILFDFLASRIADGFRLDVAAGARSDLAKRLTLYKLRAKVEIAAVDAPVVALWGGSELPAEALVDTRFAERSTARLYGAPPEGMAEAAPAAFAAHRIRAGIAEAEADFPASDVFPHDVLLDQNGGVSFRKGCFVGQEVVSRMQHRGTARRRLMLIEAEGHIARGVEISAGGKTIGKIIAAAGSEGMALVRLDRLAEALAADAVLAADGVPVVVTIPPWAGYTLPQAGSSPAEGEA
ncbi:folate-binding protein [Aurantimonas sp. MSK8Z-1]|uniref:CAF17-like 4Fe-4S cluster assembly/insertion protein YgfZ n=1 Tax=Mangrovibrevibacter kandeliae TaxID=2968473 RepID=UPI0021198353|nr:folate-binding protein [Aurantimonas sp. MSK8Z-1]MCW4113928.1 folate-binding protein [Aurantimonas sp. MSK8Z-1]